MSIFVKHTQPFTAVPNHLVNNDSICAEALAVITYLAGKPMGWIARAYDIKKRFKWGDFTWRRVSKELKALGLLRHLPHSDGTQLIFELTWAEQPLDNSVDKGCEPPVGKRTVEKPTVGNQRTYKERYTKKDLLEKKIIRADNNCSKNEQQILQPQSPPKLSNSEKAQIMRDMKQLIKRQAV